MHTVRVFFRKSVFAIIDMSTVWVPAKHGMLLFKKNIYGSETGWFDRLFGTIITGQWGCQGELYKKVFGLFAVYGAGFVGLHALIDQSVFYELCHSKTASVWTVQWLYAYGYVR